MIPRSAMMVCTALLFLAASASADPMKFKSSGGSPNALHFTHSSNESFHSNIKFLGGFKSDSKKHDGFFNFHEDHFVLVVPFGNEEDSEGPNGGPSDGPVSTPEPGTLALLLAGALALGAFAYRRRAFFVPAQ